MTGLRWHRGTKNSFKPDILVWENFKSELTQIYPNNEISTDDDKFEITIKSPKENFLDCQKIELLVSKYPIKDVMLIEFDDKNYLRYFQNRLIFSLKNKIVKNFMNRCPKKEIEREDPLFNWIEYKITGILPFETDIFRTYLGPLSKYTPSCSVGRLQNLI